MQNWWRDGILYQIYPLSFRDTNGDGKGDLQGIREHLDYLAWLGVDAIWISPIFPSPMRDCGYDIADYCGIAADFGTLADFDALIADAHGREIRVILDFVPNHTSDQHPWFIESRASRGNPRRDWYIWRDPAPDGGPPNNWLSNFGGSAWQFEPHTGQYYYHAFLKEQPDLNWRNPAVREAMHDVLRFWLDRGVDGFRVDVLWHLMKDTQFRDNPPNPEYRCGDPSVRQLLEVHSADQPGIFDVIVGLRGVVDAYPDRILIGEIYLPLERLVAYYGTDGRGVHMPFNFHLIAAPWNPHDIAGIVAEYERLVPPGEWPNWVMGNHDQRRIASRVGAAQARVAAMLLLTLRGTPTLYYGDELGMEDVPIPVGRRRDAWSANEPGVAVAGRDPQRTPMQWNASAHAGFSTVEPWLPVASNYTQLNVEALAHEPHSILALYRRLLGMRREQRPLVSGGMRLLPQQGSVLAYERFDVARALLVVLNLGHEPVEVPAPTGTIRLSTHLDRDGERIDTRLHLRADEGVVVDIGSSRMTRGDLWQGCTLTPEGAQFRTWAPAAARVTLVFEGPERGEVAMKPEPGGFHVAEVPGIRAGALYRYCLDEEGPFPDPASRFQPQGVHGPSMVVDPAAYRWQDDDWQGVRLEGQVIYEMHVGTFTRAGTFDAARALLEYLGDVGITLIEVMPIAEFPGRFGWGYDGVAIYAPYHGYGDQDAFKRFVDAAHAIGIGVILDVVYNHFGPDGAHHSAFSRSWFTDRYRNDWGEAINYDGPDSAPVRAFAIDNARYWVGEFHLDGLRLDATQSIVDASDTHIIAGIATAAREAAGGRSIVLVAENEPQDVRCITPVERGGFGLDAMWNDDWHHTARVVLTGSRDGYLHDYEGTPQEFISAIRRGFLYQGQHYPWQGKRRGTLVTDHPAARFVHYLQNHDQVANSLRGDRAVTTGSHGVLRILTALTLLGPQTPMLFMGQEAGASERFAFFADHNDKLAPLVYRGRREFVSQFATYAGEAAQAAIPPPDDERTFADAKLDVGLHRRDEPTVRLHRDLLRMRRKLPALAAQDRGRIEGAVLGERAFVLRWAGDDDALLLLVNFGTELRGITPSEPLLACHSDRQWDVLWSTEDPCYGGGGTIQPIADDRWTLQGQCATLLHLVLRKADAPHDGPSTASSHS